MTTSTMEPSSRTSLVRTRGNASSPADESGRQSQCRCDQRIQRAACGARRDLEHVGVRLRCGRVGRRPLRRSVRMESSGARPAGPSRSSMANRRRAPPGIETEAPTGPACGWTPKPVSRKSGESGRPRLQVPPCRAGGAGCETECKPGSKTDRPVPCASCSAGIESVRAIGPEGGRTGMPGDRCGGEADGAFPQLRGERGRGPSPKGRYGGWTKGDAEAMLTL